MSGCFVSDLFDRRAPTPGSHPHRDIDCEVGESCPSGHDASQSEDQLRNVFHVGVLLVVSYGDRWLMTVSCRRGMTGHQRLNRRVQ